jgi:signal transduction histidine kinase
VHANWPGDRFLSRHGLGASALAVLPGPGGPLGLLGAFETGYRAFEPDEIRFLEAAAACLSAALDRHRSDLERQGLYARLAVADRMVSLGTLTGGVAHELNNPLSYVVANLAFIVQEVTALGRQLEVGGTIQAGLPDSAQQIAEAAADARDGVEKLRGLVRDLQTLSGGDEAALAPVDLTHVLQASISVAGSEINHRARVEQRLAPTLPPVRASEARLGQVFLNLLVNAAHAIPEGETGRHVIGVRSFTEGDERVVVEVIDTGCGIPADRLERIFDPFFSTKAPGASAGLGLSLCRSIVEALGGEIQVESQVGAGATFRVLLPVAPAEATDPPPRPAAAPARRARILVVDDEPLVGTVIERTLGGDLDVVPVGGPRDALALLARGEKFDLIFSDLMMPGMTGMELFSEVERLSPALASRMVFLSGGAFTPATRDFLARPGMECIEKPFDLDTIRATIARRLAAAAPA